MTEPTGPSEIYYSRDYPVLLAIARWEAAGRPDRHLRPETIAKQLEKPLDEIIQSTGRLYHTGLIDAADASSSDGDYFMVLRLTGVGLEESGLYPRPADLSAALREVLEREAQATEKSDPERSRKIRAALDAISDVGTSLLAKVAAELVKSLAHLP